MSDSLVAKLIILQPLPAMVVLALRGDNLYLAALAKGQKRRHVRAQELTSGEAKPCVFKVLKHQGSYEPTTHGDKVAPVLKADTLLMVTFTSGLRRWHELQNWHHLSLGGTTLSEGDPSKKGWIMKRAPATLLLTD